MATNLLDPIATSPRPPMPDGKLDPAEFGQHRAAMLRFARRKIRDGALAEDAVQDALVSAVAAAGSFNGQAAVKTWLIGILDHKIHDSYRRESRYVQLGSSDVDGDGGDDRLEAAGQEWHERQHEMADDPSDQVARWRLVEALHGAIDDLPATIRQVFQMQVLDGAATAQVCATLGISESNCWVRLHRARKHLAERMQPHLA